MSLVYIQIYANKLSAVNRVSGIINKIVNEEFHSVLCKYLYLPYQICMISWVLRRAYSKGFWNYRFLCLFSYQHAQSMERWWAGGNHRDWGLSWEDCAVWQGHASPWPLSCPHSSRHVPSCSLVFQAQGHSSCPSHIKPGGISQDTGWAPWRTWPRDGDRDRGCRRDSVIREIRNTGGNLVRKDDALGFDDDEKYPLMLWLTSWTLYFSSWPFWQQISET